MILVELRRAPSGYILSWRTPDKTLFQHAHAAFKMHFPRARFNGAEHGWLVAFEDRDVLVEFLEYLSARFELEVTGGVFDSVPDNTQADDSLEAAFATLHLLPDAPLEVVKAAHKALALIHHPDRAGGDVQRMQAINAAFDLIMESLQEAVAA
jgi:hypothetical protein